MPTINTFSTGTAWTMTRVWISPAEVLKQYLQQVTRQQKLSQQQARKHIRRFGQESNQQEEAKCQGPSLKKG